MGHGTETLGSPVLRARLISLQEMASDELRELRNAMTQEAIREHQMAKTSGTTTDLFQCSKCKKKNCTYNQVGATQRACAGGGCRATEAESQRRDSGGA
jgi:hypothetical protein